MNLQLDHFSDVIQYLSKPEEPSSSLTQHKKHFYFCRSTPNTLGVEHGSHNVSRWMTWLSISLKNAAACDKWYQLQNHFITESLNANGAWEKPFVGHPRACYSQCRTNKKKEAPLGEKRERKTLHSSSWPSFFKLRARAQARHTPLCAAVWLGVCCVLLPSKGGGQSLAARLAQPNVFQKETLRLF